MERPDTAVQPQSNGNAPAAAANGKETAENLDTSSGLNGAQITAVLQVLEGLVNGVTPRVAAIELLVSVGMQRERAETIVDEVKRTGKAGISDPGQLSRGDMDMSLWWDLRRQIYVKPRANAVELAARLDDATDNTDLAQIQEDLSNG